MVFHHSIFSFSEYALGKRTKRTLWGFIARLLVSQQFDRSCENLAFLTGTFKSSILTNPVLGLGSAKLNTNIVSFVTLISKHFLDLCSALYESANLACPFFCERRDYLDSNPKWSFLRLCYVPTVIEEGISFPFPISLFPRWKKRRGRR